MPKDPSDRAVAYTLSVRTSLIRRFEAYFNAEVSSGRMKLTSLPRAIVAFLDASLEKEERAKSSSLEDQLRRANDELNRMRAAQGLAPLVFGRAPDQTPPTTPAPPAPAYNYNYMSAPPVQPAPPAYPAPAAPPKMVGQTTTANITDKPELILGQAFINRRDAAAWAPLGTPAEEMPLWELTLENIERNPKLAESRARALRLTQDVEAELATQQLNDEKVRLTLKAFALETRTDIPDDATDADRAKLQAAFDADPDAKTVEDVFDRNRRLPG